MRPARRPLRARRSAIAALATLAPAFLAGAPAAGAQGGAQGSAAPAQSSPSLVVLITVDQLRGDYLDRFRSQLSGGLDRLQRGGATFTDAHHDHAITETAPGHAVLLSGRHPRSTGIYLNRLGVEDRRYPLIAGGIGDPASPERFQGTTLADWLRDRDGNARIVSVSMKDRGAILPVGRLKTDVYWYSPNGFFTTSSYYARSLPDWVKRFNVLGMPQGYAGATWDLILPDSAYREKDSVSLEGAGRRIAFPHPLPADGAGAANLVRATPYMDEITLAFAVHALRARELGADRRPNGRIDLLAVSLSATDVIGHRHGPDSREMHDNVVRLDRALGAFLDSLYAIRDSTRIVVALTSDHGVGTIPELSWSLEPQPKPLPERVSLYDLLPELRATLRASKVDTLAIDVDEQIFLVDRSRFRGTGLDPDSIVARFIARARATAGVLRVDRLTDMYAAAGTDPIARRWSHQFPRDVNIAAVVTVTPFSTIGGNVASHGSPHPYDSHVPLLLAGAGIRTGRYTSPVRTVDLAPTLAALLGLKPSERLDGVVLKDALARGN